MTNIKLVNNTDENIRLAIFKKPYKTPSLSLVAWMIEDLPRDGGNTDLEIPSSYQVYINYSKKKSERVKPFGGTRIAPVDIDVLTARFIVREEYTNDRASSVATMKRVYHNMVNNEIHIINRASFGVWGHVLLGGTDVYPPQIVTPGRTLMEDIRSPLFAAVIDECVFNGNIVKVAELSSLPSEIFPDGSITVSGSRWCGYQLTAS